MPRSSLGRVVRLVNHLRNGDSYRDLTDLELLQKFRRERNEDAFSMLVRRHGGWVLNLCRRVLNSAQDAEDAFQATFLVLARKAGTLRNGSLLSNWLHGVALRTARKARALSWRRLHHETNAMAKNEAIDEPRAEDRLIEVVEEELQKLPAKVRQPLFLCYYEGKTREEVAQALRCSPGAVKSSLERGKKMLRVRLAKRGFACSLAALSIAIAQPAVAVAPALVASTLKAIFSGTASAQVAFLTRSVLSALLLKNLKSLAALALLTLGLAGAGWGWHSAYQREASDDVPVAQVKSVWPHFTPALKAPNPAPEEVPAPREELAPNDLRAINFLGQPIAMSKTVTISSFVVVVSSDGVFSLRVHPTRGPELIGPIAGFEDLDD
ncbi:MAG: sigma-70 family RNA polymerase sigma factor [Planctomycetes bacterium]|nr:sigma-70 family RNA polymerase sigma factor [Planctomycetota bacterium]